MGTLAYKDLGSSFIQRQKPPAMLQIYTSWGQRRIANKIGGKKQKRSCATKGVKDIRSRYFFEQLY